MSLFNLKKFNLGAKVTLRNGKPVTSLTYFPELEGEFKLIGVVDGAIERWTYDGMHWGEIGDMDLSIETDRCEAWVNVYRDTRHGNLEFGSKIYKDYTDAENNGKNSTINIYVCTIRITHEE